MSSEQINPRRLTADHIGRTVTVTWHDTDRPLNQSFTGEVISIKQSTDDTEVRVEVGPMYLSAEVFDGAPSPRIHLHHEF